MNRGEIDDPSVREDLKMFVNVATAMREATRALLKANTKAWEAFTGMTRHGSLPSLMRASQT